MKPVITWAKLLGIPLDNSKTLYLKRSWKLLLYGTFMFCFNISSSVSLMILASDISNFASSAVQGWTRYIHYLNMATASAASHISLFAVVLVKWPSLWHALHGAHVSFQRNDDNKMNKTVCISLKRVSIFASCVIAVVSFHSETYEQFQ